jgi:hypothetical protein
MPHRPNGKYVSNSDALAAWTPVARDVLLDTARGYHATIAADALAHEVQRVSGILADSDDDAWVGRLLERVAADAERRGEPSLAALCPRPDDSAVDAAARLACYRAYAEDLPADGGEPGRIFRVTPARASRAPRATTRTAAPKPPANQLREVTCMSCWMIVPAREECTSCGAPLPAS